MRAIAGPLLALAVGAAWSGTIDVRAGLRVSVAAARAADPGWRAEFDDVCSRTQDAMTLSADELRSLVARCDKLRPAVEGLDESQRKVFSRRLKACRDLYQFVLDSRGSGTR